MGTGREFRMMTLAPPARARPGARVAVALGAGVWVRLVRGDALGLGLDLAEGVAVQLGVDVRVALGLELGEGAAERVGVGVHV